LLCRRAGQPSQPQRATGGAASHGRGRGRHRPAARPDRADPLGPRSACAGGVGAGGDTGRGGPMTTAGVLLAAGHSRRWGPGNKLLAEWNGLPLAAHAAKALAAARVDLRAAVVRDSAVAALLGGLTLLPPDGDDQS